MEISQLKFNCTRCNYEASPTQKDDTTYTVKCCNEQYKLSMPLVHPRTVNLSLAFGTLKDNLRDYFIVERLWK